MLNAEFLKQVLSQHPLLIVFDILAIVAAIGCLVVLVREAILFRGYRRLKSIAKGMATSLEGSIFRDADDLVINGFFRGVPAVVRFSFAENTPEVHVWMKATSALTLYVTHKSVKLAEGRVRVPTRDAWFDDRFVIRTDNPNDAVALLTDDRAFSELKKLCCSPGTAVALTREALELSELTIPHPDTLEHLLGHMDSLAEMAVRVGALSNLKSKTAVYRPDRYLIARAALVLLIIAGGIEVYSAVRHYNSSDFVVSTASTTESTAMISETDASLIGGVQDWRVATPDDFDPTTVGWLTEHQKQVAGRIPGFFNGSSEAPGTAYVLVRKKQSDNDRFRIVIIAQGHAVVDGTFHDLLAVQLVPKDQLSNIQWRVPHDAAVAPPDGDALMIIRRQGDAGSASVFYLSGGKIQTNAPTDYFNALLRQ